MKTHLSGTPKLGMFFAVAFLALEATPAATAASAGSGTVTIAKERPIAFNDAYAFRAEDSDKKQLTVVILSESPMDKKAMTAALRKEREQKAIRQYLPVDKAWAQLLIERDGKIDGLYLFMPPSSHLSRDSSRDTKSDVKVNTAKRVEGRFTSDEKSMSGEARKIDLRFATDLADVGAPVKN